MPVKARQVCAAPVASGSQITLVSSLRGMPRHRDRGALQFKLKARGLSKFLLGQATVPVSTLVGDLGEPQRGGARELALHGCAAPLHVTVSWEPIVGFTR